MRTSLKYLKHQEIDKEKWDRCVRQSSQSLLYALSFYLDIVAPNWAAIVDEQDNEYLFVMPLTTQTRYGITFLHQPLFCQQLGVFFSSSFSMPLAYQTQMVQIILKHYRFASHYHLNIQNNEYDPSLSNFQTSTRYTHLLPLRETYRVIYQNYSLDRKKNLKRAQKANLNIIESTDIEPLIQIFDMDISKKIKGGIAKNSYHLLRKIYQELHQRKMCRLLYTQNSAGEINAGALFAFHQNQIIYLFNAAYTHARKENGRMLLIDYIIKTASNSDAIFDFESPEIASIAYFYKSFGAKPTPYQVISFNYLPTWTNLLWSAKKKLKSLLKV